MNECWAAGRTMAIAGASETVVSAALAAFTEATERQECHRSLSDAAARDRALALDAIHKRAGLTYAEIAALTELSAARVGQMIGALNRTGRLMHPRLGHPTLDG